MTSSCTSSSSSNFFPTRCFFRWRDKWKSRGYHKQQQFVCAFPLNVHLLRWEIVWRNAPRIWQDFGSALRFQTRLTQTKSVLPLSNEHSSQVKDQGRQQCCHNKHKNFPVGLHVAYLYFPDTPHICSHTGNSVQRTGEVGKPMGRCGRSLNCDLTPKRSKVTCSAVRELVMDWWPASAPWFQIRQRESLLNHRIPSWAWSETTSPHLDHQLVTSSLTTLHRKLPHFRTTPATPLQIDCIPLWLSEHCCHCTCVLAHFLLLWPFFLHFLPLVCQGSTILSKRGSVHIP